MATVQCANNHVYDDSKYHICPYCPVPGLKGANIPGTQAAPLSKPSLARTEAASPQGADLCASLPVLRVRGSRVSTQFCANFCRIREMIGPCVGQEADTPEISPGGAPRDVSIRGMVRIYSGRERCAHPGGAAP